MDPKGKVALLTGGARIGQLVAIAWRRADARSDYRNLVEAAENTYRSGARCGRWVGGNPR